MITLTKHINLSSLRKGFVSALALFVACLFMGSCQSDIVNYNDGYAPGDAQPNTGEPVIEAIYDVADTQQSSPLAEGTPGQTLRIVGRNLNNVQRITFNTLEADLTNIYTASTIAIVTIPSEVKMGGDNALVYTTDKGAATYNFPIPVPDLQIDGLQNEFAAPGTETGVLGKYFELYGFADGTSTVTINGAPVNVSIATDEGMLIEIPANTPDNSTILFQWIASDGSAQSASFPFRPSAHLMYSDLTQCNIAMNGDLQANPFIFIEDDSAVNGSALGTPHLHFYGRPAQWTWYQYDISENLRDMGFGEITNPADYLFVFEVMTAPNAHFPASTNEEQDGLLFGINWGDRQEFDPAANGQFNTQGEWQTVKMELAPMATNGFNNIGTWQTFDIVYKLIQADAAVDFRLGNFRLEKKSTATN